MDIKKAIKARGKKITEVAECLGISQSALTQQIQNNSLTLAKLEKIASYLGCSLSELLQEENDVILCPHCGKPLNITLS